MYISVKENMKISRSSSTCLFLTAVSIQTMSYSPKVDSISSVILELWDYAIWVFMWPDSFFFTNE